MLPVPIIKKIVNFLAENVFKYSFTFAYIFKECAEEDDFIMEAVVETPVFPLALSTGLKIQS